jgi:hypothetical protein
MSPVLIWQRLAFFFLKRVVSTWYVQMLFTALHLSSSVNSLVSCSSLGGLAKVTLGDLCWSSSSSATSSLNSSLNGVNLVALDSEVSCDHMTIINSLTHFPLGLPYNFLDMP